MSKFNTKLAGALTLTVASIGLAACGGMPENRTVYSTKQPVVERTNYTLDVRAGAGGLSIPEQQRLSGWFDAMDLRYGDRVSIEDPMLSGATKDAISKLAARHGILVSDGAPVTSGYVQPGNARVVLTRSTASVPGCPDWSVKSEMNYNNGTHPGYGCATNGNIAAMVADPEDLVSGDKGSGEVYVQRASKAVDAYREKAPEGVGALPGAGGTGG
ncbi:CpaD family pilus assembly protein [Parerythrobacter jejuensis]|uniref:Pilus assembly protein CpaD n=1 Tax=Parerythrobacter jejuensis TaxID=795812 RepID=A0A845AQ62_9SPHN|nr:CpaD family pilus assembly protein [Parerythrobacter jejuensis]MXP31589.1 pilus assembly protein CpaD [Parerythrobacter jejuensis]